MRFNELVAFLDNAQSSPSDLGCLYHDETYDELSLVLVKEGVEKIERNGEMRRKKVSEIVEAINQVTALHLAVVKDRSDIVIWLMKNKPISFLEKKCCLKIEDHFFLYEDVAVNSSQFHAQWNLINDGKRMSERKEEKVTAQELAEHLGKDCSYLFNQQLQHQNKSCAF